ncbi:MAG: ATP-binding protein [Clostridiales Family XIII bacterium]|nr:ATP-binding protein [Clostridiales Family XIII bacterium]
MFVGRDAELKKLNEMYASGKFEFAIIYGRRRVGKTTLIKEFLKGKKGIYFIAREAGGMVNLKAFSNDVYSVTAKELVGNASFSDWDGAFDYISQNSMDGRLVLAIDEYPFLAGGYRPISSILQAHIDAQFTESRLFLILCGSSMSFMENQVLGYKSPLYGRRTAQFKIAPFSFFESLPFLEAFPKEGRAILYGVVGGVPEYLNKISASKSVRENIIDLFLTSSGLLFEEPGNLMKQELREPSTYNGIIGAIAGGASRLSQIATKCGIESNKCAKYLSALISLGIVKKELPIAGPPSQKSIYLLGDMMFRFWYRFVFPNLSGIVSGIGGAIFDFDISEELSAYMGVAFEEICKQYLMGLAREGALPFPPGSIGRWWGNNPHERRQEEIDLMAFRKDSAMFCECKWTNALVDIDVLNALTRKSELFHYKNVWFWLFAKTGFTDRLIAEAGRRGNVKLVSFEEMAP